MVGYTLGYNDMGLYKNTNGHFLGLLGCLRRLLLLLARIVCRVGCLHCHSKVSRARCLKWEREEAGIKEEIMDKHKQWCVEMAANRFHI